MPRSNNSLFGLRRSLFSYHNSQSTSMSSSLSAISELSGATSSTSDSVTSANGSVAREAVRACWMDDMQSSPWGWGRLFEAGRLLTFPTLRVGAYLRWALIRGWALNRINTVFPFFSHFSFVKRGSGLFSCVHFSLPMSALTAFCITGRRAGLIARMKWFAV